MRLLRENDRMNERPSDLLPCPCCGSPARLSKEYEDCDGNAAVECSACNLLSWTVRDWNARTLDAAPSEPSAEHWRAALYEAREFQEWITTQQAEWIEQRAREIAREGK